ncbi:putative meiotically up-regulated 65 protein [Erysiphe necator]|uniref:Putative meiotically up-regulated 65 protein n=1 Tax=Uncinula necator TaxID=52586 RepID=A0A0B1PES6_UNCNE|nr:putative meiotically up-regulated 65 protein [Erysiphe necator]
MSTRLSNRRESLIPNPSHYHHHIQLIDNTLSTQPSPLERTSSSKQEAKNSKYHSLSAKKLNRVLHPHSYPTHLRNSVNQRKYAKYQDHDQVGKNRFLNQSSQGKNGGILKEGKNKISHMQSKNKLNSHEKYEEADSAVDILYENQRGGIFFGKLLFSARALGNLDPAPWTNIAQKPSATNILNSQPPDPSWKWVGKQWSIYPTEDSSEGWEYSFAFHGKFSWHKCKWWNSFVRRRAWVRKRVRRKDHNGNDNLYAFDSEYFTVNPVKFSQRNPASSVLGTDCCESYLLFGKHQVEDEAPKQISNFEKLTKVMKTARIDREITEAVENFTQNREENYLLLKDQMHKIMHLFIFQASRRILIFVILKQLRMALDKRKNSGQFESEEKQDQIKFLDAALKAAKGESDNYEYWSEKKKLLNIK